MAKFGRRKKAENLALERALWMSKTTKWVALMSATCPCWPYLTLPTFLVCPAKLVILNIQLTNLSINMHVPGCQQRSSCARLQDMSTWPNMSFLHLSTHLCTCLCVFSYLSVSLAVTFSLSPLVSSCVVLSVLSCLCRTSCSEVLLTQKLKFPEELQKNCNYCL